MKKEANKKKTIWDYFYFIAHRLWNLDFRIIKFLILEELIYLLVSFATLFFYVCCGCCLYSHLDSTSSIVVYAMPHFVIPAPLCDFFAPLCNFWAAPLCNRKKLPHVVIFLPHFVILCVFIILGGYHLEVIVSRQNCRN